MILNQKTIGAIFALGLAILLNLNFLNTPVWAADSTNSAAPTSAPPIIPITENEQNNTLKIPHDVEGKQPGEFLVQRIFPGITAVVITITGGLALVFTVLSGIMLLVTFGRPAQATQAKQMLSFALIGIVISGLSYAIVKLIASIYPT